ncbi:MAG TPA: hypothetical protein DCR93_25315 [Cytophagales bacterium]|nr:hypothetical protein [Cytophagales bacterium]HAP62674.1 hypothetical protein [Cytophagales bacterium]
MSWRAGISKQEYESIDYFKKGGFSVNEFWDLQQSLKMIVWLHDRDSKSFLTEEFDTYVWLGDSLHDPPIIGKPTSFSLLISEVAAEILSSFLLSRHRVYPVELFNEATGVWKPFMIIQFISFVFEELDYKNCEFLLQSRKEILEHYDVGEITNYQHYLSEQEERRKENRRVSLIPKTFIYTKPYDMIPSVVGGILSSRTLKESIEKNGLKGFEFSQIPDGLIQIS